MKVVIAVALAIAALLAACQSPAKPRAPIENRTVETSDPLTSETLARFLSERFAPQLRDGTFVAEYNDTEVELLEELNTMGIRSVEQLARIVPHDFEVRGAGEFIIEDPANIPGLVRDFMMIHDADRYFEHAWQNRWQSILPANVSALRAYVTDFTPFYQAGVLTTEEVADAPAAAPASRSHHPPPASGTTVAPW